MPRSEHTLRSAQPTKVLFVITDLDSGGAEKCCVQLATGLDRSRWQPAVCCLTRPGVMAERLASAGIPVYSLGASTAWHAPIALVRLALLIKRVHPSLVHTFLFHANLLGRLAAKLAGNARVVSGIRVAERRYRYHLVLENLTCRLAERIVCVSDAVARFSRREGHLPSARLVVIPNGVETESASESLPIDRASLGLPAQAAVAIYVGRLDPQKGVDTLLRAFAAAVKTRPDLHLILVGTGPDQAALEALGRQLRVERHAHFLGWRSDVRRMLGAADFFVLASRWEGMPNAVLEAMAASLAVVATRAEGTTELVRDGETGLLVPVDATADLTEAILAAVRDPDQLARWGRCGLDFVRRNFSQAKMIARYEVLYESVLAERASR